MRLVKHSADSIAALRAMEYRRGRKALVKDKFAKKLADTKYATNACECECECFGFSLVLHSVFIVAFIVVFSF